MFKYVFNKENLTASIKKYISNEKEVSILEYIEEEGIKYKVTSIGSFAFSGCSSLKSITIPDSVTSIGVGAFSNCFSLTSVTIGNNVISIGYDAFLGCYRLVEVCNKSNLDIKAGSDDFPHALNVYNPETGSSKLSIDNDYIVYTDDEDKILIAYRGKSNKLVIPNYITKINHYAFSGCFSLTSITIPDSVTSIGNDAFSGCYFLTSITIPSGVTSIGRYAFWGCPSLTINCEADEKPAGWDKDWNPDDRPVNWGIGGKNNV